MALGPAEGDQWTEDWRRRLIGVLDHAPEGVVLHDGRCFTYANPQAAALLGCATPEELIGRPVLDFIHPDSRAAVIARIRQQLATGEPAPVLEEKLLRRDGALLHVEVAGIPLGSHGGRPLVLILTRDVTARRNAEAQRELLLHQEQAARQTAEESIRMREDFLSIASHELRTPIAALQMAVQNLALLADRGLVTGPQAFQRVLGTLQRQTQQLSQRIDDVLDTAHLSRGGAPLEPESFDLAALAREVVDDLTGLLARAGCAVGLCATGPLVGRWDRRRIGQVLINLLTNAARYGAGRPVDVTVEPLGAGARITVRDHGIGIAPADQARIFGPFERAVPVSHYGGLGIGLYIVRRVVDAHGGTITVDSRPGDGATFVVELPERPPSDGWGGEL